MQQILQCINPDCRLRFPVPEDPASSFPCPRCGQQTEVIQVTHPPQRVKTGIHPAPGPEVEVLLDNIRSAWNVGSMLRSADGAGVRQVHICGISPTPENPKTFKTSLGAEGSVSWTYHPNGLDAAKDLKSKGLCLWALEGGARAESIFQAAQELDERPIGLVVGNEISGIDPEIFDECVRVVSIPMVGFKRSLNVAIAFGIAVYLLRYSPCIRS